MQPLAGAEVIFALDGKTHSSTSDDNGIAHVRDPSIAVMMHGYVGRRIVLGDQTSTLPLTKCASLRIQFVDTQYQPVVGVGAYMAPEQWKTQPLRDWEQVRVRALLADVGFLVRCEPLTPSTNQTLAKLRAASGGGSLSIGFVQSIAHMTSTANRSGDSLFTDLDPSHRFHWGSVSNHWIRYYVPAEAAIVGRGNKLLLRNVGRTKRRSSDFALNPGSNEAMRAVVLKPACVKGLLPAAGEVRIFRCSVDRLSDGRHIWQFYEERKVRTTASGSFEVDNLPPGLARIGATWREDRRTVGIVQKNITLTSGARLDVGLMSALDTHDVAVEISVVDATGNRVQLKGVRHCVLACKTKQLADGTIYNEDFLVDLGETVTVRGLPDKRVWFSGKLVDDVVVDDLVQIDNRAGSLREPGDHRVSIGFSLHRQANCRVKVAWSGGDRIPRWTLKARSLSTRNEFRVRTRRSDVDSQQIRLPHGRFRIVVESMEAAVCGRSTLDVRGRECDIEIEMIRGRTVSGIVVDGSGQPRGSQKVRAAYREDFEQASQAGTITTSWSFATTSDPSGRFTLAAVHPGSELRFWQSKTVLRVGAVDLQGVRIVVSSTKGR